MTPTTDENVARVKDLYAIIVNGELGDDANGTSTRVEIVRDLERLTGKQFRSTSEFHNEVSAFLARKSRVNETIGTRLKRARRKAKMTQDALATLCGVTRRTVINWEMNETPPSPAALGWLNSQSGHQGEM